MLMPCVSPRCVVQENTPAAQPTERSGPKVQFGLLTRSFENVEARIGRLFARESIPRFRGMPRLCGKGEERRTSGAATPLLADVAWYCDPIGPRSSSGSSNVTGEDEPLRDACQTHANDENRFTGRDTSIEL